MIYLCLVGLPTIAASFRWDAKAAESGVTHIKINRDDQKMYVYNKNGLVGSSDISTGKKGYRTPAGTYQILEKHAVKRSNRYGRILNHYSGKVLDSDAAFKDRVPQGAYFQGGVMRYFMRLTHTGIGIHEGHVPNRPASHGCIRVPKGFAAKIFSATPRDAAITII